MSRLPIGVFDSGLGGLTVLNELRRLMPGENIIYFGDTARVPYGNKSRATVLKFTTENILSLLKKKVKMVVIACNTASALALDDVKDIFTVPVVGVVEAGVVAACRIAKKGRIGVIATRSTIRSCCYQKRILEQMPGATVISQSCPLFVSLVEDGFTRGLIVDMIIEHYLKDMRLKKPETVILGCTHYPLLKRSIASYLSHATIIDSAQAVASHVRVTLAKRSLLSSRKAGGRIEFYVSDDCDGFKESAQLFLKKPIGRPKLMNI